MKMLECIAMLNYLLGKLEAGKRVQVPVSVYDEIKSVLIPFYKKVSSFSNDCTQAALNAMLEAVNIVDMSDNIQYLTDATRDALVEGIQEVKDAVALQAFNFFKVNDFEPTEDIIPLMREVVRAAAMKGVI